MHLSRYLLFFVIALFAPLANGQTPDPTLYFKSGPIETINALATGQRFEVPIERVGHSFTFYANDATYTALATARGLVTTSGIGYTATLRSLLISTGNVRPPRPPAPRGPNDPPGPPPPEWWVRDNTAGQDSPHLPGLPGGSVSLLDCVWTTVSGVTNIYFAIPDSRASHGLIYGNSNGAWSDVSLVSPIGTFSEGTSGSVVPLHWYTAFATKPANTASAFIADRTTKEKAAPGLTDVRAASKWSFDSNYSIYPLVPVKVQLDASEAGHIFSVHGWVPGAPKQLKTATAQASTTGSHLSFVLGDGMKFIVTRDAENGHPSQPIAPGVGTWTAAQNATFSASSQFPNVPVRVAAPLTLTFRINARTRPNHIFSVRMSDGYTKTFGPVTVGQTTAYMTGQINGTLDGSIPNNLPIYIFPATVDPTVLTMLHDDTNGTWLSVPVDKNPVDWLDGWKPDRSLPDTDPAITLTLSSYHVLDLFQLRRYTPGWSSYLGTNDPSSGSRTILSLSIGTIPKAGADAMGDYWLEYAAFSVNHPLPTEAGPFLLDNLTTNETREGVFAGPNDLLEWFESPKTLNLQISSSRQGHRLAIRHPNGDFFPVENGNIANSTTAPPGLPPWYQDYYYFDAIAVARGEMPWYIEDLDTGERLGASVTLTEPTHPAIITLGNPPRPPQINPLAGPTNTELINWVAVPPPYNLQATELPDGTFNLTWNSTATSADGAFTLERREGAGEGEDGWYFLETFLASETFDPSTNEAHVRAALAPSEPGKVANIRVVYKWGGQRSIPSNFANLINGDSDGDQMPDWWEHIYGLDNSLPLSASGADADGDGITNLQEFQDGTDPRNFYNGVLPVIALTDGDEQISPPNTLLTNPLIVKVTESSSGEALANAPVTFKVTLGRGKIRETASGANHDSISLMTNSEGRAQVFYLSPDRYNVRSRITVSAKVGARSAQASFAATTIPDPIGTNNPNSAPDDDWDGDGLTNAEEEEIGSDPQSDQSDDDGVPDGLDAMPADSDISFPRAGSPHYALIDIGPGSITAVNGKGQAVGTAPPADSFGEAPPTAFFWDKGMRKLLQGRKAVPRAVNDSGEIVGEAEFATPSDPGKYHTHAAYWASADVAPIDLGALIEKDGDDDNKTIQSEEMGYSTAVAINNSGMIVGTSAWGSRSGEWLGTKAARFTTSGKPTHLGPGKIDDQTGIVTITGLDDNGNVVGYIEGGDNAGGALWEAGKYSQNLGTDLRPSGITAAPADDLRYKYYISCRDIYSPEGVVLLGARDGSGIVTVSMPISNPSGFTARGLSLNSGFELWINGKREDLSSTITPPEGQTLSGLSAVNSTGILGAGFVLLDIARGAILLPVELRAYQYVNGPHGSPPMYSQPRPDNGDASGELFSLWPNEKATFRIGEPLAGMVQRNELPAGTIKWTADELADRTDTSAFDVQWATSGARVVTLHAGSSEYQVLVNLPNTGSYDLNSADLIARVGPIAYAQIGEHGLGARSLVIARYGEDPGTGGTRQDAIRHSTWNAWSAQDCGIASTLLVTTANEFNGRYSSTNPAVASNCTMDLHNNGHGAAVGGAYLPFTKTPTQLAVELEGKYTSGKLAAWTPPRANVSTHSNIIRNSKQKKFSTP